MARTRWLFLLLSSLAACGDGTDGFGRRVCGIPDVDGDGTDDLVVADAEAGWHGRIWTVSGKDGHRIRAAAGDADHA